MAREDSGVVAQRFSPWVWGGIGAAVVGYVLFGRGRGRQRVLSPSGKPYPTILGADGKPDYSTMVNHQRSKRSGEWYKFRVKPEYRSYVEMTRKIARKYGIPEEGLMYQFWYESRYDPNIESPVGAQGVGQLMPKKAVELGVITGHTHKQLKEYRRQYKEGKRVQKIEGRGREGRRMRLEASRWFARQPGVKDKRTDPLATIEGGAKEMKALYKKYGNWATALGAYNWGEGKIDPILAGKTKGVAEGPEKYMASIAPYYHSEPPPQLVGKGMKATLPWPSESGKGLA